MEAKKCYFLILIQNLTIFLKAHHLFLRQYESMEQSITLWLIVKDLIYDFFKIQ